MPILEKMQHKFEGWRSKLLSAVTRLILTKHVLQAILIYYLSVINPPKGFI